MAPDSDRQRPQQPDRQRLVATGGGAALMGGVGAVGVNVIIESRNTDGVRWSNAGRQTIEDGPLDTDEVTIRRAELDRSPRSGSTRGSAGSGHACAPGASSRHPA